METNNKIARAISMLIVGLSFGLCLCGMTFIAAPLLGLERSNGEAMRLGEGVIASSGCFIPAAVLFIIAMGIYFILGRNSNAEKK